jgi:hypothetical protein
MSSGSENKVGVHTVVTATITESDFCSICNNVFRPDHPEDAYGYVNVKAPCGHCLHEYCLLRWREGWILFTDCETCSGLVNYCVSFRGQPLPRSSEAHLEEVVDQAFLPLRFFSEQVYWLSPQWADIRDAMDTWRLGTALPKVEDDRVYQSLSLVLEDAKGKVCQVCGEKEWKDPRGDQSSSCVLKSKHCRHYFHEQCIANGSGILRSHRIARIARRCSPHFLQTRSSALLESSDL